MTAFGHFYLDKEKDIIVNLFMEGESLSYVLRTPNHATGNLITNLARLCGLPMMCGKKCRLAGRRTDPSTGVKVNSQKIQNP